MKEIRTSPVGKALIKDFERFRAKPYLCPAGLWTQGWGHTSGVRPDSPPVTEAQAEALLADDLAEVERLIAKHVRAPLTQGQYDAFASILFNVGPGSRQKDGIIVLKSGEPSTLLRKLNVGDYAGAAAEFLRWNKARQDGALVELGGLTRRRLAERALFERPNLETD
jgi:lysozyme